MKSRYRLELVRIKTALENFYKDQFANDDEEYSVNKRNKKQIEQFIIQVNRDGALSEKEKQDDVSAALDLLARNTGSAEDREISENILDYLFYDLQILSPKFK